MTERNNSKLNVYKQKSNNKQPCSNMISFIEYNNLSCIGLFGCDVTEFEMRIT